MIRTTLTGLALLIAASAGAATLRQDAVLRWTEAFEGFGSYSGLTLDEAGQVFTAVSDKGSWVSGILIREDGRLTGVDLTEHGPLLDPDGAPVRRYDVDAEGMTVTPDGRIHVSFEANHRVWTYDDLASAAIPLPRHPDYDILQNNSSLEALASDADGAIYTILERSGALDRPFPVYRYANGVWDQPFSIPREGAFLVTGADFGPDGQLYVLERDFRLLGFATRVRRFTPGPSGFGAGEVLLHTLIGTLDNMEAIRVWHDPTGQIRVTLLSDDNNSFLQSTMFVEYILE